MTSKSILVMVPTFNRKDMIELTSHYLRKIPFDPNTFSFLISDDCSTDYGLSFLETAYAQLPHAKFMRTSRNCGALKHIWVLLRFFLNSDYEKVFLIDSDMIVHESCMQVASDFNDELLSSLYNSCFHEIERSCGAYCTKRHIGSAGALIDKSIVSEMFGRFGSTPFDDWALSEFAMQKNLTIKVSTPSAIEHIGVFGANNAFPEFFDHAFDFPPERIEQATLDYFSQKHGFDLLAGLRKRPETAQWEMLRSVPLPPSVR
jgi:glycosyltransferase involved in cell wall biosynthesis